jgi:hypothetical protein
MRGDLAWGKTIWSDSKVNGHGEQPATSLASR